MKVQFNISRISKKS